MTILYSGTEGTCQWTIDDQGHLYIGSGVINHNTTSYNDWGWHSYRDNIVSVSSGQVAWAQGANSYGMFWRCIHATSFDLSNFDTHNNNNMMYMFGGCWSLTSLDLSGFDTSNVTNMRSMFDNCTSLTSLNLSNFNTSQVTDMYYMFVECSALNIILVSNLWQVGQVVSSYAMFGNCRQLKGEQQTSYNYNYIDKTYARIDGGPSNPGYLTDINSTSCYASFNSDTGELRIFRDVAGKYDSSGTGEVRGTVTYWSGIEDIEENTEPMWHDIAGDITSVNIINQFSPKTAYDMFNWCYSLTSLDLSNLNTSNVTNMHSMFASCTNITSLDVSHFNTANVTNMDNMFGNCMSLTSLDVSHFNTSNVIDMEGMFAGCEKLTSLDLSNFDTSKVTTMIYMFDVCEALVSLNLSSFNTSNVLLMDYMFSYCTHLTTIVISELWDTNKVTTSNKMFSNCVALKGEKNTAYSSSHLDKTYAHIDGGVSNPGYLTNINSVPCYASFDSSNGELRIFRDVSGKYTNNQVIGTKTYWTGVEDITGFTEPKWHDQRNNIQSVQIINKFSPKTAHLMFDGCNSLTSLNLSNIDTSDVTNMDAMFYGCRSLTSLDLSNFNTSNVIYMYNMFCGCNSLTSLDLSSFNTSNVTTMRFMFFGCESLISLNLSSFNISNVTDMSYMFRHCESLTYLELKVSNIPQSYSSIFDGTNCPIYIINARDSSATNPTKAQVATAWREIVASYSNAHYEADDLTVTFASNPTISRGIFPYFSKFVSPDLQTYFTYESNNLLPNSWHFNISKVTGHLKDYNTNFLNDTNPTGSISDNFYQKIIKNYYFNNKTTAILSLYVTIYDTNNVIKESNRQVDEAESNVSGANLPTLDGNFILDETNKFLCQIINNTHTIGIYAYDESYNYSGIDIPTTLTINNESYTVTKLNIDIHNPDGSAAVYGCFESNNLLTSLNSIPINVTDIRRFMYGCNNLNTHNIIFKTSSVTEYISAFTNTKPDAQIYLIDNGTITGSNTRAKTIASNFANVHYNAEDNNIPIFNINQSSSRFTFQTDHFVENDSEGEWVQIEVQSIAAANNALPIGWANELVTISGAMDSESISLKKSDGSNVTISNLINSTLPVNIYAYVGTQGGTVTLTVVDSYRKSAIKTLKVTLLFAMLDFVPGGQGMAIGKIASRNGLDIAIPTTIGEGLMVPTVTIDEKETVDLTKYQLVIGQYNNKKEEAFLVIGNGTNASHRQNALEIGYQEEQEQGNTLFIPYYTFGLRAENSTIGHYSMAEGYYTQASGLYSHAQNNSTIANKPAQTAIGKYNIADTAVNEADQKALIIGNGTADNARSNALTVDWNGNITRGDGASYTAVQITRWS